MSSPRSLGRGALEPDSALLDASRRLPPGYYAQNFRTVLGTVEERYGDLLTREEAGFIAAFEGLSTSAQRLYVRLISRRGPCFRRDRLRYAEIPAVEEAAAELAAVGFLDAAADLPPGELLPLLRRDELQDLARELSAGGDTPVAGALKAELLVWIEARFPQGELDRGLRRRIHVLRPLQSEHILTLRLLFFGNLTQDLSTFVLDDLGVVRYEPYELRRDLRLFQTRAALDDTLDLLACRRKMSQALDGDAALAAARAVLKRARGDGRGWDPSAHRLVDRILIRAGRLLERQGEPREALGFYRSASTPPARERCARILDSLGRTGEAWALCREIASEPRDETEATFAPAFAKRLERRRGEGPPQRPRKPRRVLELYLRKRPGEGIEEGVLAALREEGRQGFFAQNWLWRSLFGLAFWDIVFAPVPGAFEHPFQLAPLDLDSPAFRNRRRAAIEERLDQLRRTPDPAPRLLAVYDAKHTTGNRLVAWAPALRPHLELALLHLRGVHLAWVFDRLSRDPGRYRRGFPDLFVVAPEAPGFQLWEVKGPGDQLRPEQRSWLEYLDEGGLPGVVVRVSWR